MLIFQMTTVSKSEQIISPSEVAVSSKEVMKNENAVLTCVVAGLTIKSTDLSFIWRDSVGS